MGMATWTSSGTASTVYYTTNSNYTIKGSWDPSLDTSLEMSVDKKYKNKRDKVLDQLKGLPAIQALLEAGLISSVTNLIVPGDLFEKASRIIREIDPYVFSCYLINADKEGLFFRDIEYGRTNIVIYNVFDEDLPMEVKANFIKKGTALVAKGGTLILLAEKEHPDNLKDLVAFANIEVRIHDITFFKEEFVKARGIYLIKL